MKKFEGEISTYLNVPGVFLYPKITAGFFSMVSLTHFLFICAVAASTPLPIKRESRRAQIESRYAQCLTAAEAYKRSTTTQSLHPFMLALMERMCLDGHDVFSRHGTEMKGNVPSEK
jgi:hypothetical protein